MKKVVEKEWRRLLRLVGRCGFKETTAQVCKWVSEGQYPLFLSHKFSEYLLKNGEYVLAGKLIKGIKQSKVAHPLLDELYSSWLWCSGKRRRAIASAARSAKRWRRPYLFSHLAALHKLNKETEKAQKYFHMARCLAGQEMAK